MTGISSTVTVALALNPPPTKLSARPVAGPEVGAPGRYVELAVPFTLTEASVLEFPCFYRGETGVWFDRLRVERLVP